MDLDDEVEMLTLGFSRCLIYNGVFGAVHWCCDKCGALVGDPARHHDWHEQT